MARKRKAQPGPYLLSLKYLRDQVPDAKRYPHNLPAFRDFNEIEIHPKVTFFVGENGSGKSTLIEAMAVAVGLNPEGGTFNFGFSTRDSHSDLCRYLRLSKSLTLLEQAFFLRAESFFNVGTEIERLDVDSPNAAPVASPKIIESYGGRSLHEQSHGESFFALFKNRLKEPGLYFLDEPESALSPTRQLQFLVILNEYVAKGAQFVIATHSPILLAYPRSKIFHLDGEGMRETAYDETEHYKVTRGFLNNTNRSLEELFKEDVDESTQ